MKKIIYVVSILFLSIVIILNVVFTAKLDDAEHIQITTNNTIYVIGLIFVGILIFLASRAINKALYKDEKTKKIRKILFICSIIIYIVFCTLWTILVRPPIVGDQIHACNLAQTFYRDNPEEFLPNLTYAGIPLWDYMQAYHQQISLAFVFSLFFKIIHFDGIGVLRVLNVVGNISIFIALYKIGNQLSKEYKINKVRLLILILTFLSLPMLSTFIYGDIPSLALCLFSIYFMMRYTETKKIVYPICASIFTMIAYMLRMNSLIFVIATIIYLLFNLFKEITKKTWKENLINTLIIILYIVISIIPTSLVNTYYLNKYNMDKNKAYPKISYFLMAMEEAPRGNGWYNESIGEPALKNPTDVKDEYNERIKQRLTYFSENIGYTFKFYTMKIASMWTENTYSAVYNNNVEEYEVKNIENQLMFYQKTLLILTCICCLVVLLQNRKHISINIIYLLTIFIGGFAFHILWEAKSRYIIPYIIVLIPIASIIISKFNMKQKLNNILYKIKSIVNK